MYLSIACISWCSSREGSWAQAHGRYLLDLVGEPLYSERRPLEGFRHHHVVQKRHVLFPYLVVFVEYFLLELLFSYSQQVCTNTVFIDAGVRTCGEEQNSRVLRNGTRDLLQRKCGGELLSAPRPPIDSCSMSHTVSGLSDQCVLSLDTTFSSHNLFVLSLKGDPN